jgi:hypothetical protein
MDIDGDGGREFGLRGQRRGTESDKGTAPNSLSGYHAPGLKRIVACLSQPQLFLQHRWPSWPLSQ